MDLIFIDEDAAGIMTISTRKHLHQCGFSCTIGADESVRYPRLGRKADIVERLDSGKLNRNVFHFNRRHRKIHKLSGLVLRVIFS